MGSAMIQKSVMMFTPEVATGESVLIHMHAKGGSGGKTYNRKKPSC